MQVSSVSNSLYTQNTNSNKNKRVQQGNGEYLHKAVRYGSSDKIIEFTDKDSNTKIQFYSDESMEKSLQRKFGIDYKDDGQIVKATGDFENYLQKMWSFNVNDSNTKDINTDGYLDLEEASNSKRIVNIEFDNFTKELKLELSSTRETSSSREEALEKVKNYFKDNGLFNNRISVDEDFNKLLKVDKNLDANIEDMEILADLPPHQLMEYEGLNISEKKELYILTKNWKKKKKEEDGNLNLSEKNSVTLMSSFDYLDKLLNSDNLNKESNDIKTKDLNKVKENLKSLSNYVNTQADNAKIFSLKV